MVQAAQVADLTKLDDRWHTAIWLGKSDRSDEQIIGVNTGAVLARSVRRKADGKRWSERALKLVTGTPWNPRPGELVMSRRYITRALVERYGPTEDCRACFRKSQHSERCRARFELLCAGEDGPVEVRAQGERASSIQTQQHRILFQRQRQHKQVKSTRMRWRLRRINRQ